MGSAFPFLLVILVLALFAVFAYFSYLQAKRRRDELGQLAAELGWRFESDRDGSFDEEYGDFEIFRRGHSRCAYNSLWGPLEIHGRSCPAKMGDYEYKITSSNGKSKILKKGSQRGTNA